MVHDRERAVADVVEPDKVAEQRRLYGEPVGDVVRRIMADLDLTQGGVSRVLGLSPAMLSQLMSAQRVKIGNPLAVARLQALLALSEEAAGLTRDAVAARLEEIGQSRGTLTTGQWQTDPAASAERSADLVRRVLRAVASGRELDAAARSLEETSPALAEVIRVYGTGSREEAERHLAALAHLLRD